MRFAEYTDDTTFFRYRTSVYLLRAADHEAARVRAVEIGREQERTYRNAEGALFRTALVGVDTLDMLGDLEDGVEVAHWPGRRSNPRSRGVTSSTPRTTRSSTRPSDPPYCCPCGRRRSSSPTSTVFSLLRSESCKVLSQYCACVSWTLRCPVSP
ncbi:DUF4288 domain-containing protein [Paractinoplanes durhamensis]|uniref:DUF4288 domain-containing protein n=1 Tax=Paractinoplanes durhamensis TaxID=113563 RepID=UPI00362F8939